MHLQTARCRYVIAITALPMLLNMRFPARGITDSLTSFCGVLASQERQTEFGSMLG